MPHPALKSNVNSILIKEQRWQIMQKVLHIMSAASVYSAQIFA